MGQFWWNKWHHEKKCHDNSRCGEPNDNFVKNESKPKARIIAKGENPKNFIYKFKNKIISLEEISNAASGIGSISLIPNIDGVIRNVPVLYNIDNRIWPSLALDYDELFDEIDLEGLVENKGILYIWNDKDLKSRELEIKIRDELGVSQQLVNKSEIHDLEPHIFLIQLLL